MKSQPTGGLRGADGRARNHAECDVSQLPVTYYAIYAYVLGECRKVGPLVQSMGEPLDFDVTCWKAAGLNLTGSLRFRFQIDPGQSSDWLEGVRVAHYVALATSYATPR